MPIEDEFNPSAGNPFVGGKDTFESELSERARRLVPPAAPDTLTEEKPRPSLTPPPAAESTHPNDEIVLETRPKTFRGNWSELSPGEQRRAVGAGATTAALLAVSLVAGPEIVDSLNGPEYSPNVTTYTVQPGDGWYDVVEAIDGYEAIDRTELIHHVQADPANIDFLSGDLQPGQSITIPTSVEK